MAGDYNKAHHISDLSISCNTEQTLIKTTGGTMLDKAKLEYFDSNHRAQ
jgi:hypothetical protein